MKHYSLFLTISSSSFILLIGFITSVWKFIPREELSNTINSTVLERAARTFWCTRGSSESGCQLVSSYVALSSVGQAGGKEGGGRGGEGCSFLTSWCIHSALLFVSCKALPLPCHLFSVWLASSVNWFLWPWDQSCSFRESWLTVHAGDVKT